VFFGRIGMGVYVPNPHRVSRAIYLIVSVGNDCLGFGEVNAEEKIRSLELELAGLEARRQELRTRINSLKEEISNSAKGLPILGKPCSEAAPTTTTEKLDLFLKLFRGRQDIYAKRWENLRTKKSGYAPVCANEWVKPLCEKPRVKCAECAHQKFLFLDERAVEAHLKGQTVVGTYAIRSDDTCIFLACDFDDKSWRDDVDAYKAAAAKLGVDVAVERS